MKLYYISAVQAALLPLLPHLLRHGARQDVRQLLAQGIRRLQQGASEETHSFPSAKTAREKARESWWDDLEMSAIASLDC